MNPKIQANEPQSYIREFDRSLKEKISSRQGELANLRGWRRLLRRVRIECWAWVKTLTDKSKSKSNRTIE